LWKAGTISTERAFKKMCLIPEIKKEYTYYASTAKMSMKNKLETKLPVYFFYSGFPPN
jgi:hypothetical protein